MYTLDEKQYMQLEDALNQLFIVAWELTNDKEGRLVSDARDHLNVAMNLMFDALDPLRTEEP